MPLTMEECRYQANAMVKQLLVFQNVAEVIGKAVDAEKLLNNLEKTREAAAADLAQIEATKQQAIADTQLTLERSVAAVKAQTEAAQQNVIRQYQDQVAQAQAQVVLAQSQAEQAQETAKKKIAQVEAEFATKVEEHACLYGAAAQELTELQQHIAELQTHIEELNKAHEDQKLRFQADQDAADTKLKKTKMALKKLQQQIAIDAE